MDATDFTPSDIKRFWSFVAIPDDLFGCWIWTGWINNKGYGCISVRHKNHYAHRTAWILTNGPIPPETPWVLHDCPTGDNPLCCNPSHLFLGTHATNMKDMVKKGRSTKGSRIVNAKLKETDIPVIRAMLKNGISQKQITFTFGVSNQTISAIHKGLIWRHIE